MAKILLADDSSFMRKVLIDILIKNGYETVVEAENGKQAVEMFNSENPDLVMLDIIMPEMDGIAVLKEIVPKGAKALVISAVGQDDIVEQANAAGAKGYIIKPFDEKQVLDQVKKILDGGGETSVSPVSTESAGSQPVSEQMSAPATSPAPAGSPAPATWSAPAASPAPAGSPATATWSAPATSPAPMMGTMSAMGSATAMGTAPVSQTQAVSETAPDVSKPPVSESPVASPSVLDQSENN